MAENLKQTIEFQAKGIAKLKKQYKELEQRTRGLEGATNKAGGSLGGLVAKLGLTTVALYGTMRAISSVVSVGREFTKNMSNVAAISGATAEQLKALEANARQLGATTVFTASQVAELQTEFAKLGFTSKEIRGVTKDTLALAAATGSDLAVSAAVAGQTLRAFGLDVSETSRVTDTMALSFSRSALDMDKFTNSMQYVAPVAKAVGFNVEGTTALLGGLANAGISGSLAGTALRTVFLKLADSNSDLTKRLGGSVKSADELIPALKKLSDSGVDLTEVLGLVDKRAVSAFKILLDGTESVAELKAELDNAGGSAQKMADVQLDNLDGSLTLMNSAMEGLGLRLFEFVEGPLRGMVDGLTDFATLLDEEAIKSYSVAFGAVTAAVIAYNSAMIAAKLRTIEFQATLIKTGWGAVIVGAGLVVGKVLDMTNVFSDLESEMREVNEEVKELDSQLKALAERRFAQLLPEDQVALMREAKKPLLELYDEGSRGAAAYQMFVKNLARDTHKYGLTATEVEEKVTKAIKAGVIARKESEEENPLLGGVTPDLTNQQLALYQQFLDQRAELFGMDTERQLEMLDDQTNLLTDIYVQQGMDVNQVIDFYAKARQSILLADTTETLKLYSQMATGFSSFLGEFAGMAKVAARIQQASALIDAYATANALMADPKLLAAFPLNIVAATAALASGLANVMQISKSIGEFKSAATGFDGVVDRPTLFMTGEGNKKERVSVTPLESANVNGPQGGANITINVSAPLMDETVIDTIIPAIKRAERLDLA